MAQPSANRKKRVFRAVVREYIETAEPVASGTIVAKYNFGVSPATIRNDMAELEMEGLLEQPHTSAGRVPTPKGYRFFVEEFAGRSRLVEKEQRRLRELLTARSGSDGQDIREFARAVAALADQTVVFSFGDGRTYITGVANLFRQPESQEARLLSEVSRLIDDLDAVLEELRLRLTSDVEVFIGGDNPFGQDLSSVVARLESPEAGQGLFGILGPRRMDYEANVALMRYIHEIFSSR